VPLLILIVFLLVPAAFADFIAQHDHTIGDLGRVLEPPGWVQDSEKAQVIVQRARDTNAEVSINNARRNIDSGAGTLVDANGNGQPDIGETMVRVQRGGNWEYPLGTDKQGRDVLSRLMHGARISLAVSCLAILLGGFLGTALGMLAAFRGGLTDAILMRIVDIKLAFPSILLALTLVVAIGSGFSTVVIVIALLLWARYARVVRGEALTIKERDFIDRARVAGASNLRIMGRHIFPNVFNTVIVLATLEVGHVIILEATLSFLGAGIPRPQPAWGLMAADGREVITSSWWIFLFPCLAIVLTVLSMNLLGDWLRDRLDPKLRNV
jgi:peptide/nickel transport system permease protein